jgi:hypothetical protein
MRLGMLGASLVVLSNVAALALSAPAYAAPLDGIPDDPISVSIVTTYGSGCKPELTTVEALRDNTGFRVGFIGFRAQVGGDSKPVDFRKNCQVVLSVTAPHGYAYAIDKTEHLGGIDLAKGIRGEQRAHHYSSGFPSDPPTVERFHGPIGGDWAALDGSETIVFSRCGEDRYVNLNTEVRVIKGTTLPGTTVSFLEMHSSFYGLTWKKCQPV